MKMRKHNFMSEKRGPFKCSGPVRVGSANQFVLHRLEFDELGLTELLDQFRMTWDDVFQFHSAQSLGEGVGHCRSRLKNLF